MNANPETSEEIRSIWFTLERSFEEAREGLETYRTRVELSTGPAFLGLDPSGQRHLLVPVPMSAEIREDSRSGGVQLKERVHETESGSQKYMDVLCVKPHLDGVFSVFASEVLDALIGTPEQEVQGECRRVLEDWRELFARETGRVLGRNALAGLFAELWHLREMSRISPGSVGYWKGPSGGRIDFTSAECGLEVKSTLRRGGLIVEINGHRQLEFPDGDLFLAVMKLEESDIGTSVPDLVRDIIEAGVDRADLGEKLLEAGYRQEDEAEYRDRLFRVVEDPVYRVDGEFPRIVSDTFASGDLPAGVLSISYLIDLSGSEPAPIEGSEVIRIYEALTG